MGERETLLDFFDETLQHGGEYLVYDTGYRSWSYTYRQTVQAARAFAARLQRAGIRKGDRVLIWSENRPEWIVTLWGCLLSGAVAVPVDYRVSADLLLRTSHAAGATLLIAGNEVEPPADLTVWPMDSIDWNAADIPDAVPVAKDDLAQILFTSGTTAEPKGVTITHRNILANIVPVEREVRKYLRYERPFHPIRFLNLLPLSHLFGQSMAAFIPPMTGGVVVFMHGYSPEEITHQIRSRKISVLVSVPKILDVLRGYIMAIAPESADTPPPGEHWLRRWWRFRRVHRVFGWKFWSFIAGAAPLDPTLEEFWRRMGFLVVQGYGLTETAPIVTLNHPFHTRTGSVGKPIAGVEIKIAPDGEVLVRGENVTTGYFGATAPVLENGWFHTGDIGEMDSEGRLRILGRKKEMIVTPEGLNVFPEDVERVLNSISGVRDSAVVGIAEGGQERVHAVLLTDDGTPPEEVIRQANARLEPHQRIRGASLWKNGDLPRTEGTRKLKRSQLREWVITGKQPQRTQAASGVEELLAEYSHGAAIDEQTRLDDLGLSSLDRVALLTALEQRHGASVDDADWNRVSTVADLKRLTQQPASMRPVRDFEMPRWNRSVWARAIRRTSLPTWVLPLARIFLHVRSRGLEHLRGIEGPVIFAANHQSHMDVPSILIALPPNWRYRAAPAMSKEFFDAHFYPERHTRKEWFTNSLNYYLGCLMFQAFPLPQRERGARGAMRYAGELASEGICVVIFPEGKISDTGAIAAFQPGVGMLASTLRVPVVPVRLVGLTRVLHRTWRFPSPGRVEVIFGAPLHAEGEDYAAIARRVEQAVRALSDMEE